MREGKWEWVRGRCGSQKFYSGERESWERVIRESGGRVREREIEGGKVGERERGDSGWERV